MTASEQEPAAAVPCSPCRGTGRVISNLGGEPSERACPWCAGTGTSIAGGDAQAEWRETGETPPAP